MPVLLRLASAFTLAALSWLVTMYFALHHAGYEARAAVAASAGLASALILIGSFAGRSFVVRVGVGALGLGVLGYGGHILWANHQPNAGFEGYAEIIGLALVVQGGLALAWTAARRT